MIYECKICNYETSTKFNLNRHIESDKHKNKAEKLKNNINDKLQKENDELKEQLNNYKFEIKIQQKEIEKLESINKILSENKIVNTYNKININSNNNSAYSYAVNELKEAPPLKKLDNFVIDGLDPNNKDQLPKFIDNIIYSSKNKSLDTLLGNHLIKVYKKNNLNEQSFHSTDTSRLNYIVKLTENLLENYESSDEEDNISILFSDNDIDLDDSDEELKEIEKKYKRDIKNEEYNSKINNIEQNNDDYWYIDKHGHKISRLVIDPLLRKLIRIFKKKIQAYLEETKKNIKESFGKNEIENIGILQNILQELDSGKLKKDINKFIASKFFIDNKIKKIRKNKN